MDYFLTFHDNVKLGKICKVTPISPILEDHSVITLEIDNLSADTPNHQSEHEISSHNSETNSQIRLILLLGTQENIVSII